MRLHRTVLGLAGLAGAAAAGAMLARRMRGRRPDDADARRDRLQRQLAGVSSNGDQASRTASSR
ncbi:MAG: hypothetical protein JXA83_11345 [Acidimicrobiales bacterium]|nr:hypothetical protein [Acidimicrobiales bacterium]